MVKSLYSGVSGLKTHQQRMDVIGNNIANVNTTGFKTDVVTFADVYYQTKRTPSAPTSTLGGVNPRQVGYGVKMNSTTANMSQSGYTYSDKTWDMALDGEGFFQVMDGAGNIYYTRAGAFDIDEAGYLVNANGYHVLGVTGNSEGQQPSSEIIRIVIPSTDAHASSATKMVNGTNVTLAVSAPSDYTDMTVSFQQSNYPFATYANGILSIFFNTDMQYESEEDFERAINQALDAGGITLPDGVELTFQFESIPDEPNSIAAKNSVDGYKFTTANASCEFHYAYASDPTNAPDMLDRHSYIGFAVADNTNSDTVTIVKGTSGDPVEVAYADGAWTITINDKSSYTDIDKKLKEYSKTHPDDPKLTCNGFIVPAGADRDAVLDAWAAAPMTLAGVQSGSQTTGLLDFSVQEKGEFANDYKITFAYLAGYDKTSAVWDGNNLTINVCANSTIAEVNEAIKTAARGNERKIIKFNDISGLDYGDGYDGSLATVAADGTVTPPAPKTDVWNPEIRKAYFSDHPEISPKGGLDSFFTGVAKSLSTFALEGGRSGAEQSFKDLSDITLQTNGEIIGYHPVHGYMNLGRIDIATFDNPNGLSKVGGTLFAETVASGPAKLAVAGQDGAGEVLSGTLEMSNVDLADEFTNMITTQRGYQANSRVITVSDTMLEELLSLKR